MSDLTQQWPAASSTAVPAVPTPNPLAAPGAATPAYMPRPTVRGKFFEADGEKLTVRGVTYGTFSETDDERQGYPERRVAARDFDQMARNGINTVRTYTVPPRWVLDAALKVGLRVLVGLPWEQHVTFLDTPGTADSIDSRVREGVRACAGRNVRAPRRKPPSA